MRLDENIHQLASTYEYSLDWVETEILNFEEVDLSEVQEAREYIKNSMLFRDENIESRGEDRALKLDIEMYYNLVSSEITDPLAFIALISGGGVSVPYLEQIGSLVDNLANYRFLELEDMHIGMYLDLVTARRDILARMLEVKEQSDRWYEQVRIYEREVLVKEVKRRLDSLKRKEELSPYNLYDLVYRGGQAGRFSWVGVHREGALYTFWLHQLGIEKEPRLATLEEKFSLYKTVYNITGGDNVRVTKKEVDLSQRFSKMLEKEMVGGNINKEDIQLIRGEHNTEAYSVGKFTVVFLGKLSFYWKDESKGREVKIGEWAFTDVLVRDLKRVMGKIKEGL